MADLEQPIFHRARRSQDFTPRRGRPTQTQIEAIDNTILSVARRMFLERGYANTAMEAIAAATGMSKGTIYSRYSTKAELFHAIVEERLSTWSASAPIELGNEEMDIAVFLHKSGTAFLEGMLRPEIDAFARLIAAEARNFPELAEEFHKQGYHRTVDWIARHIEAAGVRQGLPVSNARSVALTFTAALLGYCATEAATQIPMREAQAEFVSRLVALCIGGRSCW